MKPDKDLLAAAIRVGRVPVLVLRPADRPPADVGVLWIHGGGYLLGMKEMVYMGRGADLVRKFGVTVFSPGYRLAWQRPYPAAAEDCRDVLGYLAEHKAALGLDRLMVGGESAGGGLAAAVCMMARDGGVHVSFQMPLYPMLSDLDTDSSRDNRGRVWNTRRNHLGWRAYLRGTDRAAVPPYAAPARQTDYRDLPPCYTFVGTGEPFYRETLDFVRALRSAGVEAAADVYPTDLHAFDMLRPEDALSRRAVAAFDEQFAYALEHYE